MKRTTTKTKTTTEKKINKTPLYQSHSAIYLRKPLHKKAKQLAKDAGMSLTTWVNKHFQMTTKN